MTNVRSAGNAWAKIRNKLNTADGAPAIVKKTPQKKKAAAEKADESDATTESMYCYIDDQPALTYGSPEEVSAQAYAQEGGGRWRADHSQEAWSSRQKQEGRRRRAGVGFVFHRSNQLLHTDWL